MQPPGRIDDPRQVLGLWPAYEEDSASSTREPRYQAPQPAMEAIRKIMPHSLNVGIVTKASAVESRLSAERPTERRFAVGDFG